MNFGVPVAGLVCALAVAMPSLAAPPPTGDRVFHDTFTRLDVGKGKAWGWRTGAYPDCRSNRDNRKLDLLSRKALRVRSGALTITATRLRERQWRTGLITTGESCGSGGRGFEVRTGDLVSARVRLPSVSSGAWPGIWTWRDGGNEVDLFEWHADHPDTLEFVNHVRNTGKYWSDASVVGAGRWVDVAVRLGSRRVTWYVGMPSGRMRAVFSDRRGLGPDFHAHLVVNLAVDDGRLHAPPAGASPFSFQLASVSVHRP